MIEKSYATAADLTSVLDAQLQSELQQTSDDIDRALFDASRLIDSWICARYSVPVDAATAPLSATILRQKTVCLAKFLIIDRKLAGVHVESAKTLYGEAEQWGLMVAKKTMSLPDAPQVTIPDPAVLLSLAPNLAVGGDAPVFTEEDLGAL
jgi:phage gp36-like protein